MDGKLLRVEQLNKTYGDGPRRKQVLENFSLDLEKNETIGIKGGSGIGKSTLARIIVGLEEADSGLVLLEGKDILKMNPAEMKKIRPCLQLVFQNYRKALNPACRVKGILQEAAPGKDYAQLLAMAGLEADLLNKFPKQLSGGQAQRLNIIRAIAMEPKILILDEATSGLDDQSKDEIIQLLKTAQDTMKFGLIFISHDSKVIEKACTRFIEM